MLNLSISTRIDVNDPTADGGFVTWLKVRIERSVEADADDGADEAGDESVEPVGTAKIAIVHVGAVMESEESLYDVLDADSGELEALYELYFDDGWFKDEFACAPGVDLLYVREIAIDRPWQSRNIELAVVQRLCETIGAGCKVVVIPFASHDEATHWMQMGFEFSTPEGEAGHVHLNGESRHPRVVAESHEEDRFKVVPIQDDDAEAAEDNIPDPGPSAGASPSSARTNGSVASLATFRRR